MEKDKVLLLELDEKTWGELCDNAQKWLDNVLLTQSAFRKLAEDTKDKITENHLQKYISDIHERAVKHEEQIDELYSFIQRDPSKSRGMIGSLLGKSQEAFANVIALGGGVTGPWQYLHQLFLSNHTAMGAFAVAEQLGLALGISEMSDLAFQIGSEKKTDELLLKEAVLEMSVPAILYNTSF